jgi:phospholipid/cholesterol/gamma-HCH transport system ATP-binding protein
LVTKPHAFVEVEDLEVAYGDRTVLRDVTFSVEKGDALTILGPSGCGKSTLLKAIIGLVPRRRGRVRIAGCALEGRETPRAVRERMGVLFQAGALLAGHTAGENVALPLRELTHLPRAIVDRMVQLKLDLVRLGDKGHLMPAELSGGMSRRVGLARAMALDPEVLFCDEPVSGLDPVTAREMDELLVELNVNVGTTLVVVSHELGTIENISRRCIMLDGDARNIIASGSPSQLLESDDPRVQRFFRRRLDGRAGGHAS